MFINKIKSNLFLQNRIPLIEKDYSMDFNVPVWGFLVDAESKNRKRRFFGLSFLDSTLSEFNNLTSLDIKHLYASSDNPTFNFV